MNFIYKRNRQDTSKTIHLIRVLKKINWTPNIKYHCIGAIMDQTPDLPTKSVYHEQMIVWKLPSIDRLVK